MERARATWTDERLDDLSRRVDHGFNRLDEDLRSLRTELSARIDAQGTDLSARIDAQRMEMSGRFDSQEGRFDSLEGKFDSLEGRIDALQRTMIQVGGGTIAAFLVTLVTVIAARA